VLLVVMLPDGSPGFMAAAVTDIFGVPEPPSGPPTVLSVDGARRFRSLLEAGGSRSGVTTTRRRPKPWKVVRHAHGSDPFECRQWVYSAHTTELAARRARDRVRAVMVRSSGHSEAAKWAWSVVADPVGVLVNPAVEADDGTTADEPQAR
jgi:hypothetical protein